MRALRYLWIPLFSLALMAQSTTGSTGSTTHTRTRKRTASSARAKKTVAPATTDEIQSLREALATQQQQIQQLNQQLQQRDQASEQQQQQINQLQQAAADAQTKATTAADTAKAMQSDVTDLKANATTTALSLQEEQKHVADLTESPLAIHYKGITITPGGFLAAETVWRQRGLASDVNTPFNTIPFAGFNQAHLSEFFGTGRTSRITILTEGKLSMAKLTGYYETDWLSAGITSNNNQSNSYTNRMRQLWGQAALNDGITFTGGHMWSLVTETKTGMDNRSEAVPSVIDHAYNVGFSWARQYGFRVTKNFNNLVWLGFSVENAQTTLTAHGNLSNFVFGNAGTSGGAFNPTANYSFNQTPDFVFKVVFQPKIGHYEVVGLLSQFRDRVFPNVTGVPATTSSVGAFSDSRNGVGRYGASGLPDATIRPNGTLALLHSYQGLGTIEVHYPKFDVYFNGGEEYISRWSQLRNPTTAVGYGSPLFNNSGCSIEAVPAGGNGFTPGAPGNCNADTRSLEEFTTGFYFKFYNGPKGRVQWGPQYSYIVRNTWRGVGSSPHTNENMFLTSFRYYLP